MTSRCRLPRSKRIVELAKLTYAHDYFNIQEQNDDYDSNQSVSAENSSSESWNDTDTDDTDDECDPASKISKYVNRNTAKTNFKFMEGECETNLKEPYSDTIFNTNFDILSEPGNTLPNRSDQVETNVSVETNNETETNEQVGISDEAEKNDQVKTSDRKKKNSSVEKRAAIYESEFLTEKRYKKTSCPYCEEEIHTQHFARHLERNHYNQKEVIAVSKLKVDEKNDSDGKIKKEKRTLLALIRNMGNMKAAAKNVLERNVIIPKRRRKQESTEQTHVLCPHCKGYFLRTFIARHDKICPAGSVSEGRSNALISSLVYMACQKEYGKLLSKLALKEEVLVRMRGDQLSQEIMNDILIFTWGDDLLKKTPSQRSKYHITAKMRRCANFILNMRRINSTKYTDLLSCLDPFAFEDSIEAVKIMSGYNPVDRTFKAPSTALQFGAYLQQICSMTKKLVYRKYFKQNVSDIDECLKKLDRYKELIASQWTTELASLANKELESKAADKPKLLPLTKDIQKLRNYVEEAASNAYEELMTKETQRSYKILTETTLIATILHNRKRVGDVQYLLIESYRKQRERNKDNNCDEFINALSKTEKVLVSNYERVVTIGKGSRQVPVLLPKEPMLKYYDKIYSIRKKCSEWFLETNRYFFAQPKSGRWIDGCSIIRRYASKCGAENPHLLSSVRLRKHVATITQLLALKSNEIGQLAKFMGHTMKTHDEFYKLPNDVYQMAKVSKILLMAEKGNISNFENQSLDEIEIDMEEAVLDEADELDLNDPEDDEQPVLEKQEKKTRRRHKDRNQKTIDLGILGEEDKDRVDEDKIISPPVQTTPPPVNIRTRKKGLDDTETNERPQPIKEPKKTRRRRDRKQTVDMDLGILRDNQMIGDEKGKNEDYTESEEESTCIPCPKKTKSPEIAIKGQRKSWDVNQKNLVCKAFSKCIKRKEFPKKVMIDEFIQKHEKYGFKPDDFKRIRTLVVNESRVRSLK